MLFEEWLCSVREQYHFARITHTPVLCCSNCCQKELQLCKYVVRRCALGSSSLLLIPNLTFNSTSHPSQKLNVIKYLCCILLLLFTFHYNFTISFDYEANVQRQVFCFFGQVQIILRVPASSVHALVTGPPAGGALACCSFSTAEERDPSFSPSVTWIISPALEREHIKRRA